MTESRIYTKTGDDGTTGLLYGGRVSKGDELAGAFGDIDEAVGLWSPVVSVVLSFFLLRTWHLRRL